MPKVTVPEVKIYLNKRIIVHLNCFKTVKGILRGYDPFVNLVIQDAQEITADNKEVKSLDMCLIRGNSVIAVEALENV